MASQGSAFADSFLPSLDPSPCASFMGPFDVAGAALPVSVVRSDVSVFGGEFVSGIAVIFAGLGVCPVAEGILDIFAMRAVAQVRQPVVRGISVQMTNLQPLGAGTRKGSHDQGVDEGRGHSALEGEADPAVASFRRPASESFSAKDALTGLARETSYSTLIRDLVQALVSNYRQPALGGAI